MSGLFDTLIAAARGTVPAISHRPHQRFAEAADLVPAEGLVVEESEAKAPASIKHAMAERQAASVKTYLDETMTDAPGRFAARALDATAGAVARLFPPSQTEQRYKQGAPSPAPLLPLADFRPASAESVAPPASSSPSPSDAADATILLPVLQEISPQAAGNDVVLHSAKESVAAPTRQGDAESPRFEIRIGRIEVTSARPKVTAPAPQSRPVSIPRARPRQSLDEYLRGRKR